MIAALTGLATIRSGGRPSSAGSARVRQAVRRLAPLAGRRTSGDLRRVTPIDPNWGFERGTPIDRVYVERFVGAHAADIRGRVLEIAAPDYTTKFGRESRRSTSSWRRRGTRRRRSSATSRMHRTSRTTRSTARS